MIKTTNSATKSEDSKREDSMAEDSMAEDSMAEDSMAEDSMAEDSELEELMAKASRLGYATAEEWNSEDARYTEAQNKGVRLPASDSLCEKCAKVDIRQMLLTSKLAYEKAQGVLDDSTRATVIDKVGFAPDLTMQAHSFGEVTHFEARERMSCGLCFVFAEYNNVNGMHGGGEDQLYMGINTVEGAHNAVLQHGPKNPGYGRSASQLEIYTDRGVLPEGDNSLIGCSIYPDPGSKECMDVVREWRHECSTNHERCVPDDSSLPQLPSRVIDVLPDDGSSSPRLLVSQGRRGFWVTLSYCWGGESSFKLNSATLKDFEDGIDLSEWPATLRDAVIITRLQGQRYLWIDAICILQDSLEDCVAEMTRMCDIYRLSLFTIVAAGSPHTGHGILNPRTPDPPLTKLAWKHPDGVERWVYLRLPRFGRLLDGSIQDRTVFQRAWCLQEMLLSQRLLIFSQEEMSWVCQSCQKDEKGRLTAPITELNFPKAARDITSVEAKGDGSTLEPIAGLQSTASAFVSPFATQLDPFFSDISLSDYWQTLVVLQYGRRRLTFEKDTLPAMSGIARAFHHLTGDVYLAGLWRHDFISMLTWTRWPKGRPNPIKVPQFKRSAKHELGEKARLTPRESSDARETPTQFLKRLRNSDDDALYYAENGLLRRSLSVTSGLAFYNAVQIRREAGQVEGELEDPSELLDNGCGYDSVQQRELSQFIPRIEAEDFETNEISPPSEYIAPSWSWASIRGRRIDPTLVGNFCNLVQTAHIEDVVVDPATSDSFGAVRGGHLRITARMRRIPHAADGSLDHITFDPIVQPLRRLLAEVDDDAYGRPGWTAAYEFVQQHRECEGQEQSFYLLLLAHAMVTDLEDGGADRDAAEEKMDFLVLESTGNDGVYRRVGLWEKRPTGWDSEAEVRQEMASVEGWRKRTVTII